MVANVEAFFDEPTNSVSYLVSDADTGKGVVIDPVMDFDLRNGQGQLLSARKILHAARESAVKIEWVLETHIHADHLTAAQYIKETTGAGIAICSHVGAVQETFRSVFGLDDVSVSGSEFDRLLNDEDSLTLGSLDIRVLHTPGHTPACVTYLIGDAAFVGDTLFMPDFGTARTDFPGGDASKLYGSIQRILSLHRDTRLFMCHDYKATGRDFYSWETSVAEQRAGNIHVHDGIGEREFVAMRRARDAALAPPALLLPSIQVNIRAGRFPEPEANGARYLKIPLTLTDD
jgi:glyoxylase-like metal-dependent hydrolase (beta-lactamase superfamily II)